MISPSCVGIDRIRCAPPAHDDVDTRMTGILAGRWHADESIGPIAHAAAAPEVGRRAPSEGLVGPRRPCHRRPVNAIDCSRSSAPPEEQAKAV